MKKVRTEEFLSRSVLKPHRSKAIAAAIVVAAPKAAPASGGSPKRRKATYMLK